MRACVFLLLLSACVVRDNPRYRSYPQAPAPPPSPADTEPVREKPTDRPSYPSPNDYASAVKQVDALRARIADLLEKDRLFEISSVTNHLSFLASNLTDLVERDAIAKIMEQINTGARTLQDVAELLERRAGQETKEKLLALNAEILVQLELLKKFEELSDEYEVQAVPRGCPQTYKRALTRLNGVHNSIQDKVQSDQIAEIPDVARHLKQVAENLRRIAVNDIAYPIKNRVKESSDALRDASDKVAAGAERDDKERVRRNLDSLVDPIKILDGTWKQISGKSAVDPGK